MKELIIGTVFIGLGSLFFFNNKNISKGAYQFYQTIYTEDNLKFMFRACGTILIFGGLIFIFLK